MNRRNNLWVCTLIWLSAARASAEVMDKELSVTEIWQAVLWALLVCVTTGAVWRWLLVPSFVFGVGVTNLGFTWTEWFNESVGKYMRIEAGASYGYHIQAAIIIVILAHMTAWFVSTRISLAAWLRRPSDAAYNLRLIVFAALLCTVLILEAAGGFGATAWIWISPPMLVATGLLAASLVAYFRRTE